jgi:CheY-like chemotaxis protein
MPGSCFPNLRWRNDRSLFIRYSSEIEVSREGELKKIKVVVADDNKVMLDALVRWLGQNFEVVASVQDGIHLINAATQMHPDVIVSDVSMPILTGPEVMEALTIRGHRIPFVFVTGEADLVSQGSGSVVDKTDVPLELDSAVRAAASGKLYMSRRALLQQGYGNLQFPKP